MKNLGLNNGKKVLIAAVGSYMQMETLKEYLKDNSLDDLFLLADIPVKTAEEIMLEIRAIKLRDASIEQILNQNVFKIEEENLEKLARLMQEKKSVVLNFEIPTLNDGLDFAFMQKEVVPKPYIPKKIGNVNVRAKGGYRRYATITRPYMY